jgi:DNA-binding response OmpR family regulator
MSWLCLNVLCQGRLIFANLVDFDSKFGHRNDPVGYAAALEAFDRRVPELLGALGLEPTRPVGREGSGVLFVTGDSASESTRAFLEQSGRRYLMKPFSVEDYVQAVRDTLDGLRSAA